MDSSVISGARANDVWRCAHVDRHPIRIKLDQASLTSVITVLSQCAAVRQQRLLRSPLQLLISTVCLRKTHFFREIAYTLPDD